MNEGLREDLPVGQTGSTTHPPEREDMPKAMILGCGPAGLFAAHAADIMGYEVFIYSKRRKSEMYGAQYLHAPIPRVSGDGFTVTYRLQGTATGYAEKVYGKDYRGPVSPDSLVGTHTAWDIREAYNFLWMRWFDHITDADLSRPHMVDDIYRGLNPDVVVSSIPAPLLCSEGHAFDSQSVWAVGDAPERGVFCPVSIPLNTVVCNGEDSPRWYRASNILGYRTAEWPDSKNMPPIEGVAKITKPLKTLCDCLPDVHRVGRYGKWKKGVLSHEAFYETLGGLGGGQWCFQDNAPSVRCGGPHA